jgi:hypothetical protein
MLIGVTLPSKHDLAVVFLCDWAGNTTPMSLRMVIRMLLSIEVFVAVVCFCNWASNPFPSMDFRLAFCLFASRNRLVIVVFLCA